MGLFDFFKSDGDKIRKQIRKGFDNCVKNAVRTSGSNDSFMLGLLVEGAIGTYYQSMKFNPSLSLACDRAGINYESLLEEECKRALNKYLKY